MSVFVLSVSLNQLTSITFLLGKAIKEKKKRKRKTAEHLCRKKTKTNELSQHQLGAGGGGGGGVTGHREGVSSCMHSVLSL